MKTFVVIFLFFRASSSFELGIFGKSLEFSCDKSHGSCILHNVVLESESDLERVVFPNIADPLTVASGKIPYFTRKLMDKLSGVVDLTINRLEVETLYVKPEMTHLEAVGNRITNLLVDDDRSKVYSIMTLDLSNNSLRDVEVLSRFSKLRQLTLDGNKLEHLSMDLFGEMTELRKLSLENNNMFTLDTSKKLQLLKLQSLSLAGNRMIELTVTMWDLPSLKQLDLSRNKLYMFDGSLDQFKALEDVKLSENHWKCDFLSAVMLLKTLKLDSDQPSRCAEHKMINVRQICCTHDASSILGGSGTDDLGLFNDKWDELRNLQQSFQGFKNETGQSLQRIGELPEDRSLMERIEEMEKTQKEILEKLNDRQESVAVQEVNELRSVIADHKSTIASLESKQSDLESQLEGFVDTLNDLRDSVNEKLDKCEGISEKVEQLEQTKNEQTEFLDKKTAEIQDTVKAMESQQFKYHLSSVDLKSQIGKERGQISELKVQLDKLTTQNEMLYNLVHQADDRIDVVFNMLDSISEGRED